MLKSTFFRTIFCCMILTATLAAKAAPGDYSIADIAVINAIIDNNGLAWTKVTVMDGDTPPADWTGVTWSTTAPRQILELNIRYQTPKLTGTLDVTALAATLTSLSCGFNNISVLDVSALTNLTYLACGDNNISVLNVSALTKLETLYCDHNNISMLNVSALTKLESLFCVHNNISVLNVSALTKLESLFCDHNNISMLNVSALTNLEYLSCGNNNISVLDVSALTKLEYLNCGNNNISVLDVLALTKLEYLHCENNSLTALVLNGSAPYLYIDVRGNYMASPAAVTGKTITWDGTFFIFSPQRTPPATAPHIDGPAFMTLTVGYEATSTDEYVINGTKPVTVVKVSGNDKITWNNSKKRLDIAAGLPVGEYEVVLRASNAASSTHTFKFTLTVQEKMYYLDIPTSFVGGTISIVTTTPYLAKEGETVTLNITPNAGYVLESIVVYDYNNNAIVVPLTGTGNTRTFKMPAHSVRIVATFRSTVAIEDMQVGLTAYAQSGTLFVSGLVTGQTWSVYSITGTLLYQSVAVSDRASIALSARGIYIIRSGDSVIKVVN